MKYISRYGNMAKSNEQKIRSASQLSESNLLNQHFTFRKAHTKANWSCQSSYQAVRELALTRFKTLIDLIDNKQASTTTNQLILLVAVPKGFQ
jgi:hypothetical protein